MFRSFDPDDPMLRLHQVAGASTTRFAYDRLRMIGEYDGSGALQRRYVFGPGLDEPIVQYEGSGTTDRRFLSSDERGSIIARTDSAGALLGINSYDEYGVPAAANAGRFGYTGQAWLPELGLSYYKARMYHPVLGRFLQPDPIGYADNLNLYAYVGNDPVNFTDPLGLQVVGEPITVIGRAILPIDPIQITLAFAGAATIASAGAAGQGVSGSSGTTKGTTQEEQDKKDEEEKEEEEKKRSMCVAIRGGIVVYGSKELASLALHFARGATVAEVFAAGVTAQAGSRVLIGLIVAGGAIYVIDEVSDNAISNAVGDAIGCPK